MNERVDDGVIKREYNTVRPIKGERRNIIMNSNQGNYVKVRNISPSHQSNVKFTTVNSPIIKTIIPPQSPILPYSQPIQTIHYSPTS